MHTEDFAIEIIVDLLEAQTGQRISQDRRWRIVPALSNLMRKREIETLPDLIVQLTDSDDEQLARQVVEALLNHETYFRRDRQIFDYIAETILPEIALRNGSSRNLRVWSVGCSTGQEPLSLAMLFAGAKERWRDWNIEILATDVSKGVIDFAKQASYSNFQVQRGLGINEILSFFHEIPGGWQAEKSLSEMIKYEVHNVLNDASAFGKFDLVLCRNVLLYFDAEARVRAFARLSESIKSDGWLVLGGGELVLERVNDFTAEPAMPGVFRAAGHEALQDS